MKEGVEETRSHPFEKPFQKKKVVKLLLFESDSCGEL